MDNLIKQNLENFIKNQEDEERLNLVLNKLDEFFSSFLFKITENYNNVNLNYNLLGDYCIASNFGNFYTITLLINYYADEEDLKYSENRLNKGAVRKLYSDVFNFKKNIVLTNNEVLKALYNEISLKFNNEKVYLRKNILAFSYLNFGFNILVNYVNKNNPNEINLISKNKEYFLNLSEIHNNLIEKNRETNGKFFQMVKLCKLIELELALNGKLLINCARNYYFYENLLFNIPNDILNEEFAYDNLLNAIAYLNGIDEKTLIQADGKVLINNNYKTKIKPNCTSFDYNKVLKQIKYFLENETLTNNNYKE